MLLTIPPCAEGEILPVLPPSAPMAAALMATQAPSYPMQHLRVGTVLHDMRGESRFRVCGHISMPTADKILYGPLIMALSANTSSCEEFRTERSGFAAAVITLSDKGAAGQREDKSGPLALDLLRKNLDLNFSQHAIIPDDIHNLRALVVDMALTQGYDLILTTGGTGLTSRDTTPEALLPLLERRLPGFEQAMMLAALTKTPHAMLSRAVAGCLGQTLIISLPGSSKAVVDNLSAVLPACAHAMEKLQNCQSDCGA